MKKNKKKFYKNIIVVCTILALPLAYISLVPFVWSEEANLVRIRWLCKTDHKVLLDSCREISRQKDVVSQFPKPIRDLAPDRVTIDDSGYVKLEMLPYWRHLRSFGYIAYPEDFEEPFSNYKYGDREIIEGLWYFDEEYNRSYDYDKIIDELMKKYEAK